MNNDITLVWSFRNRFDVLKKSIETAHKYCPVSINFCLVDASSSDDTIRELREFCNSSILSGRKIRICESAYRSTVQEAWNLGIMLSDTRFVIFVSSDVVFTSDKWIRNIADTINRGGEYIIVENHAMFCIDKTIIPIMGWFDERYKLGPHFDTDFMIRSTEAGINMSIIGSGSSYTHGDTPEMENTRKVEELEDRLPMSSDVNDVIFKEKWETTWPGWKDRVHPPTTIANAKRTLPEIDPHPFYTKKYVQ